MVLAEDSTSTTTTTTMTTTTTTNFTNTPSSSSSSSSSFCTEFRPPLSARSGTSSTTTPGAVGGNGVGQEFGWTVAITCDGSRIVIGSANNPAAVHMFEHNTVNDDVENGTNDTTKTKTTQGKVVKTFHNPQWSFSAVTSNFGRTVALNANGERLLVGDPLAGAVYLYDGALGHLMHTFRDPVLEQGHGDFFTNFGGALAMSRDGSIVVIGASESPSHSQRTIMASGVVYVYRLQDNDDNDDDGEHNTNTNAVMKWNDPIVLEHQHVENNDNFGISVALWTSHLQFHDSSSDTTPSTTSTTTIRVLVGAWQANRGKGAAYLYAIGRDTHSNSNKNNNDDEDGDGSSDDDDRGTDPSSSSSSSSSRLVRTYVSPTLKQSLGFGYAVDMTEEYIVVGARGAMIGKYPEAGAVYVFPTPPSSSLQTPSDDNNMMHTSPQEGRPLSVLLTIQQPPRPKSENQFGGAVALKGRRLLVASLGDGNAYSYDLVEQEEQENKDDNDDGDGAFVLTAQLLATHRIPTNLNFAGASVALSGNGRVGVLGAPRALGRMGRLQQGAAFGICLPHVWMERNADSDNYAETLYSCPAYHLAAVPWYSTSYWSSWDSWSGKALAMTLTLLISLCLIFYRKERRRPRRRSRQNHRRRSSHQERFEQEFETLVQMAAEIEMVEEPFRDEVDDTSNDDDGDDENDNAVNDTTAVNTA